MTRGSKMLYDMLSIYRNISKMPKDPNLGIHALSHSRIWTSTDYDGLDCRCAEPLLVHHTREHPHAFICRLVYHPTATHCSPQPTTQRTRLRSMKHLETDERRTHMCVCAHTGRAKP